MINLDLPRNFNIEKSDQQEYQLIQDNDFFTGLDRQITNKDIFVMSMSIGYSRSHRKKLREGYPVVNTQQINDLEKSLIASICIAEEKNVEVLQDRTKLRRIVQEFANAGFEILRKRLSQNPEIALKSILRDSMDELKLLRS